MVFNSVSFFAFFAVVLAVHHLPGASWTFRRAFLLLASYAFYAAWNPLFVPLLWISTGVDWWVARQLHCSESAPRRWWLLQLSLLTNLGLLGVFKYANFIQGTIIDFAAVAGVQLDWQPWTVGLPVGISFYTFQTLSYTIDVYRRRIAPARTMLDFALFVAFFPQLVAGPIVRAADFIPQLDEPKTATRERFAWGLLLLLKGLFAKVVLADGFLAPVVDRVYGVGGSVGLIDAWVGTLAFAGQIYFDFSGYSTCAIGVGLCLGFALPDNFARPYAAASIQEFWRRWHLSLSSWLRDYLYISLGGNRGGRLLTYRNLALTMLLGGLWHGAAWTFVVWGAMHGAFLVVERLWGEQGGRAPFPRLVGVALTFVGVCFTWVFFRARSFAEAGTIALAMLGFGSGETPLTGAADRLATVAIIGAMLVLQQLTRDLSAEQVSERLPTGVTVAAAIFMLVAILLSGGNHRAFIYFQF